MIHKNKKKAAVSFDGFGGIQASSPFGEGGTQCLENFRLLGDGSLQKREGYRHLATLADGVRAITAFMDGGEEVLLAVSGNRLCRIRNSDGKTESAAVFATTKGPMVFLPTTTGLYMLDGEHFYRYEGGVSVIAGDAYIPLLRKNCIPNAAGSGVPYEEPNLLSDKACFHYESDPTVFVLYFDRPVAEVLRVEVGDKILAASSYRISDDGKSVRMTTSVSASQKSVKVYVRLLEAPDLLTATKSMVYSNQWIHRLFLYGASDPSILYADAPTVSIDLTTPIGEEIFPLYFRASDRFYVGEGRRIASVCQMSDRLLVLSDKGLYVSRSAPEKAGLPSFACVSEAVGCTVPEGACVSDEKTLLTVDGRGIALVTVDLSFEKDCIIRRIWAPIAPLVSESFLTHAKVLLRQTGEVWFFDEAGAVFVYDLKTEHFILFNGIHADQICDCFGDTVFTEGSLINQFDTACVVDETAHGDRPIEGRFRSHFLDFGSPEANKRLSGLQVLCDLDGDALAVRVSDDANLAELVLKDKAYPTFSRLYERDLRSGRFRYAAIELCAGGRARQRIYGVKIFV